MEPPNNEEDQSPDTHLSLPNETSDIGNRIHIIELKPKGTHENFQIIQGVAKGTGFSLQTCGNTLLLKITVA